MPTNVGFISDRRWERGLQWDIHFVLFLPYVYRGRLKSKTHAHKKMQNDFLFNDNLLETRANLPSFNYPKSTHIVCIIYYKIQSFCR